MNPETADLFYNKPRANTMADKLAISLSVLCTIHCLFFPLLVSLLPVTGLLALDPEDVHIWMILAVLPTSAIALVRGCKMHRWYGALLWCIPGIILLIVAIVFGHAIMGEWGEKVLTLAGTGLLVVGHYKNYTRCRSAAHSCLQEEAKENNQQGIADSHSDELK